MTNHDDINNRLATEIFKQVELDKQIRQLAIDCGAIEDRYDIGDLYFPTNFEFLKFGSEFLKLHGGSQS
jgi:hypothetical protein